MGETHKKTSVGGSAITMTPDTRMSRMKNMSFQYVLTKLSQFLILIPHKAGVLSR